ncbi:MAG: hypothetical protein ACREVQ_15660 [Burkholderiales bacterium]
MQPFLRLRQICLVAAELEREARAVREIFGLQACYRDPNVAKYGLQNVLFPIGSDFLEIVAPTRPGTAAGRFLERHGGRHGYMAIFDCDDPEARGRHCASLGVRTANLIRHDAYLGVQLHPRDTGAAMIEFNRTEGGADPHGPYAPAGPRWQDAIRLERVRRLAAAEVSCPDPGALAARWSELLERPALASGRNRRIELDSGAIDFLEDPSAVPALTGLVLEADDVDHADRVRRAAKAEGRLDSDGAVELCGVQLRLVEPA